MSARPTRATSVRCALAIVLALSVFAAGVALGEGRAVYEVRVDGLACPFCVHGLEKQLLAIEGVETVETDIKTGIVTVAMYEGVLLAEDAARNAVEDAGFGFGGLTKRGGPG